MEFLQRSVTASTKYFFCLFLFCYNASTAQVIYNIELPASFNEDGAPAHESAMVDIQSATKGFLIPRMNFISRSLINQPAIGLLIYQTDQESGFYYFDGTLWQRISEGEKDGDPENEIQDLVLSGHLLTINNNDLSTIIDLSVYLDDTTLDESEVDAFVANNGYITSPDDADSDPTNELQDISLNNGNLSLSNGATIDLKIIDTDTQLDEAAVDNYVSNNGYITSPDDADSDPTNEIQDISLNNGNLSLSNGATIDLKIIDTDTQLDEAAVDNYVSNNGYITSPDDADSDPTNELQDISLNNGNLSLSNGATIDLKIIDTDTQLDEAAVDNYVSNNGYITSPDDADSDPTNELQDISLNNGNLSLSNGATIDLKIIDTDTQLDEAAVDAFVANNGYITSPDDADSDPTNELQDISLIETNLKITGGSSIDLSVLETDEATVDGYVSNNGYITSPDDADSDPTNEIQDISLNNGNLSLSGGSTIDLTVLNTDTQLDEATVDNYVSNNGFITSPDDADSDPMNELVSSLTFDGSHLELIENGNIKQVDMTMSKEVNVCDDAITGYTLSSVATVTASNSSHSLNEPTNLLDNDCNTAWTTSYQMTTEWVLFDFGINNEKRVKRYDMKSRGISSPSPKIWALEGSNDGINFDTLDVRNIGIPISNICSIPSIYSIDEPGLYRYYRLNVKEPYSSSATSIGFSEILFYEANYDPTCSLSANDKGLSIGTDSIEHPFQIKLNRKGEPELDTFVLSSTVWQPTESVGQELKVNSSGFLHGINIDIVSTGTADIEMHFMLDSITAAPIATVVKKNAELTIGKNYFEFPAGIEVDSGQTIAFLVSHGKSQQEAGGFVISACFQCYEGGTVYWNGLSSMSVDFSLTFELFLYQATESNLAMTEEGNLGIGTNTPSSKLQVSNGDIFIEDINNGVIMKSPDGACWRMTVSNAGGAVFTSLPCPE